MTKRADFPRVSRTPDVLHLSRRPPRSLRNHRQAGRRRHGRGLSRHRHAAKREVAIKVLPADFTEDKERLARFEREAQLLAQLNHPNIASDLRPRESGAARMPSSWSSSRARLSPSDSSRGLFPLNESLSFRAPDRPGARRGAREGHRPPRPQAAEHQGFQSKEKSRSSTSGWPRRWMPTAGRCFRGRSRALADPDELADADRGARHAARG